MKAGWSCQSQLLSLLIHPAPPYRQSPKQNSLQARVIHILYLHKHQQHCQKQAGMRGWSGANEESLKPSLNPQTRVCEDQQEQRLLTLKFSLKANCACIKLHICTIWTVTIDPHLTNVSKQHFS